MHSVMLIGFGSYVLLIWLYVAFFDRIWKSRAFWERPPWNRWFRVKRTYAPFWKAAAFGFATVVSFIFALMLFAAAVDGVQWD